MAGVLEIASADILEPVYMGPLSEEKLRNGSDFLEDTDNLDMQNIDMTTASKAPVSASAILTVRASATR